MESKKLAIRALENMRCDDLYRARAAFKNRTPDQMQEKYGHSGKTCAEILSLYEKHEAEIDAAISWVNSK